ncbi:hypothetical protein N7516_011378 [Penicillium verrucosum]|uniref:uncharacterized protein n=1 Tax=Penicillium verrucosum TaxID=60171 RepID=UPI0025451F93|nr:uncharacterized protein N7516_011378 [Penicillium verrucosum]KAJ5920520.1 hypothetical protein N7516_011378 [Penicillium verrucosum]
MLKRFWAYTATFFSLQASYNSNINYIPPEPLPSLLVVRRGAGDDDDSDDGGDGDNSEKPQKRLARFRKDRATLGDELYDPLLMKKDEDG